MYIICLSADRERSPPTFPICVFKKKKKKMNFDCGLLKDLKMHGAISVYNCQRAYHLPLGKVSLQTTQTQKVRSAHGSGITEDLSGAAFSLQAAGRSVSQPRADGSVAGRKAEQHGLFLSASFL